MKDMKINRRQILKSAGALGVLGTLGVPAAVFADDEDENGRVRWDIVLLFTTGCIEPGGTASAFAQDNSKITFTGRGTFPDVRNRCSKKVTGGGIWSITPSPTTPLGCFSGSGRYRVVELLSWTLGPSRLPATACDHIGNVADAIGGLAKLRIRYDNGTHGVLTVSCNLPGPGNLPCIFEGITASVEYEDFWKTESPLPRVDANRTIFHFLRNEEGEQKEK